MGRPDDDRACYIACFFYHTHVSLYVILDTFLFASEQSGQCRDVLKVWLRLEVC